MAIIEVAQVPKKRVDHRALLAEICWYYPQYSLAVASKLPFRDVKLLLKTAHRKEAANYYHLTQIAAAPHTKQALGVKTLSTRYQKAMKE